MKNRSLYYLTTCACLIISSLLLPGCPEALDTSGGDDAADGSSISSGLANIPALIPFGPPPAEGRFVRANGGKIFYKTAGEGSPNIVLVAGLDENVRIWDKVFDDIALLGTVVAYDRAGVGWSEPGENPRMASVVVKEMNAFLDAIGLEPPYILCAHSIGGLYARYYAASYPEKIAGIVLIDTTHEDMNSRQAMQLEPPDVAKAQVMMGVAQTLQGRFQVGAQGEYFNMENSSIEVRNNRVLPWVPLLLLSQDMDNIAVLDDDEEIPLATMLYHELYYEQASLTPFGEWRPVEDTSHFIMVDQPQAVIDGLTDIINDVNARK